MKKYLCRLLLAVSLAGCLLVLLLWVRSYWCFDDLNCWWVRRGQGLMAASSRGRIVLGWSMVSDLWSNSTFYLDYDSLPTESLDGVFGSWFLGRRNGGREVGFHFAGFALVLLDGTVVPTIMFPHWFVAVLLGGTSLLMSRRLRALRARDRRRVPPGHCRRCGYDLTGNKSGVCPECGAAVLEEWRADGGA